MFRLSNSGPNWPIRWLVLKNENHELSSRHAELVRQRDGLLGDHGFQELNRKIQAIENELRRLNDQYSLLLQQIEQEREYVQAPPNPILRRAGQLVSQMSAGDLSQVFLDHPSSTHIEIQVRDRHGKVLNFSAIEPGLQDQAYLCLILSVKEQMKLQGVETATLIDDAFSRITPERVSATLRVLQAFATPDSHLAPAHQIIALTQHRYLADRLPGIPLQELAPTMPSRPAIDTSRRSEPIPFVIPPRENKLARARKLQPSRKFFCQVLRLVLIRFQSILRRLRIVRMSKLMPLLTQASQSFRWHRLPLSLRLVLRGSSHAPFTTVKLATVCRVFKNL